MTEPTRHGEVRDQRQLHALLRALADKRGLSRRVIDELAGLTIGHTERILAEIPEKRIGIDTLFPLLWGLGLRMVIEDCPDNLARISEFVNGRADHMVRACGASRRVRTRAQIEKYAVKLVKKDRSALARIGGKARASKLTPTRRSAIARNAANARHRRERAARKAARCAPSNPGALLITARP